MKIWSWLILDIYLPSILAAIARGALITVIPLYLLSAGFSATQVGIGTAAIAIGNLILDIPSGFLVKRLGERKMMNISLPITSLAALFMYIRPGFVIILAVLYGCGRSLWLFSRRYVISYYLDYDVRGRASSFIGASERIGTFIGPSLTATIISFASYGEVFLACFIITLIASLMNIVSGSMKIELAYNKRELKEEFKVSPPSLLALTSMQLLIQGIRSSRTILLPLVGKLVIGLKDNEVALAMSMSGLLDVLGSYPSGLLMDRKGRHMNALISFSIIALGFLFLAISYDYLTFSSASMIIGLGNGFSSGLLITIGGDISNRMGMERGPLFLAFWQFIGDAGSASFPSVIGFASEAISTSYLTLSISLLSLAIAISAKEILGRLSHNLN